MEIERQKLELLVQWALLLFGIVVMTTSKLLDADTNVYFHCRPRSI
jgi:hypothetical protein